MTDWYVVTMDDGLQGCFPTKRAALQEYGNESKRLEYGVYAVRSNVEDGAAKRTIYIGTRKRLEKAGFNCWEPQSVEWQWLTTHPSAKSHTHGAGWMLHAVAAHPDSKFSDIRLVAALCGLRPRHGWTLDFFITDKCSRCAAKSQALLQAEVKP